MVTMINTNKELKTININRVLIIFKNSLKLVRKTSKTILSYSKSYHLKLCFKLSSLKLYDSLT